MAAHKHAELMAQYAQDAAETDKPWERWEMKSENREHWMAANRDIAFNGDDIFRRKPQKKVVDFSVLIKSGIDCEFQDTYGDNSNSIGRLEWISGMPDVANPYRSEHGLQYDQCRPRMNHWHAWRGGECPLPEGLMVDAILRNGHTMVDRTVDSCNWGVIGGLSTQEIITFKVTGLAEGYCWPWELDNQNMPEG